MKEREITFANRVGGGLGRESGGKVAGGGGQGLGGWGDGDENIFMTGELDVLIKEVSYKES
jgi:hypothetical protein